MRNFFAEYKYFLLLLFLFTIGQCFVQPFGNFPLNDDWSYAKAVLILSNEGKVDIGDWPAMTLVTHLLWGCLFIKVFGFSFLVLRISTWVSVLLAMWIMNKLTLRITGNRVVAFIACATLLFNPIYYNVSNSYMTDVNFTTLILFCIYFAYDFLTTKRRISFFLTFILSIALILLRQYGIIMPVCFTFACLFLKERRMKYMSLGCLLTATVYLLFLWYESYLREILPPHAAYKFSGNINPTRRLFWDYLWYGLTTRYKIIAIHALFHVFPLIVVFLPTLLKVRSKVFNAVLFICVFALAYFLYLEYPLQVGNVFIDTAVGADTTYETLKGTYVGASHFYSKTFDDIITPFKYLVLSLAFFTFLLFLIKVRKIATYRLKNNPAVIFLLSLFFSYCVMIMITESFFDRYLLPVILIVIILTCYLYKVSAPKVWLAAVPLLVFYYFSVAGTKDYFSWNNKKWEGYHYLVNENQVPKEKINGGFELNSWNEGEPAAWYEFMYLTKFDYLIQYKQEDSFAVMKEYPFQRYFPLKKDTIRIYKRTVFSKTHNK